MIVMIIMESNEMEMEKVIEQWVFVASKLYFGRGAVKKKRLHSVPARSV